MTTDRVTYTDKDWRALERRLKESAEMTELKPDYNLGYLFKIAQVLLYAKESVFHFSVGWDWNFQAFTAHITLPESKFLADSNTPEHALLLVLELWLEKRETL